MKRVRDYDTLRQEYELAQRHAVALSKEIAEHPRERERREAAALYELRCRLPPVFLSHIREMDFEDYGRLVSVFWEISVDFDVTLDGNGTTRYWHFSAQFRQRLYQANVDLGDTRSNDDFEFCDFVKRKPLVMWQDALESNDHDAGRALAAFCFACCEYLDDFDGFIVDAFPQPVSILPHDIPANSNATAPAAQCPDDRLTG